MQENLDGTMNCFVSNFWRIFSTYNRINEREINKGLTAQKVRLSTALIPKRVPEDQHQILVWPENTMLPERVNNRMYSDNY
jgi:hypothetical protein